MLTPQPPGNMTMRFLFLALGVASAASTVAFAQTIALERFRPCLEIEDMTKERLDCFDAIVRSQPRNKKVAAKSIRDCSFLKEEDERLLCFNRFVNARAR